MTTKHRHTILVVDDEPDVVKSVKDLLRLDYRVIGATSAAEGMGALHQEEVHVVMTDQRMPMTTGVEFLKDVRGEAPEAVRLLFTGYADIHAVIDAINQGNVYRYITKPWDPEELQALIREACERYDLMVERKLLVAEVQRKNAELEKANAELLHSSMLKSAFIQVASHELRTPLTILNGLAGLARRAPDLTPLVSDLLRRMEQGGQRMQQLVDQIVSMLSSDQFERVLHREPTDVSRVINDAVDDVRPFIERRGQTLALDVPPDLGTAEWDGPKLRDTLNHVLLNAIKFTPDAGTISVGAARQQNDMVRITINDTGCGIDQDCLPQLFEPFFTGTDVSRHSSGKFEHGRKGIGLGLSVARSFVRMHGGTIIAASEPGNGATFTIMIPAQAPQEGAVATAPAPSPTYSGDRAGERGERREESEARSLG
ncbi:MAG: hybrid sensor histidine kinase/response regulator [Planctomycetota bacterium]|nr:hybrid sensor histidine kinase/response regulator [Planctomycetota bacterium]